MIAIGSVLVVAALYEVVRRGAGGDEAHLWWVASQRRIVDEQTASDRRTAGWRVVWCNGGLGRWRKTRGSR